MRPGPIQGGMVHPYLKQREAARRNGKPPHYLNAVIEKVLGRTLGVPIFREQVMQLAIDAADFTPGEADLLRRSMAAAAQGRPQAPPDKLVAGFVRNGYPEAFAQRICKQIEGFGEYGFPRAMRPASPSWSMSAHGSSATIRRPSCARCSTASRWASIRRRSWCRMPAATACACCRWTSASCWDSTLVLRDGQPWREGAPPPDVRLGLGRVKGMQGGGRAHRARAPRALRQRGGPGPARRAGPPRHRRAGRRRRTGQPRRPPPPRWQARAAALQSAHRDLLYAPPAESALALPAPRTARRWRPTTSLGLSLKAHPLRCRAAACRPCASPPRELADCPDGRRVRACGIVTVRQRPATASGTIFTSIEDETGAVNVILWPDLIERERKTVLGPGCSASAGPAARGEVRHRWPNSWWT